MANNCAIFFNIQVGETGEAQYNPVDDGEQPVEATVSTLQDNGKSSDFCIYTVFCSTHQPKLKAEACFAFRHVIIVYLILFS